MPYFGLNMITVFIVNTIVCAKRQKKHRRPE